MDISEAINYYRYKPEYKALSIRRLAEQILHDNNGNFYGHKSSDSLRKIIPQHLKNKQNPAIDLNETFTIDIPDGYLEERSPYILAPCYKNTLVFNDPHIPYHHAPSLKLALMYGYEHGVDSIIINGDGIDFYGISRFSKRPTMPSLKTELDTAKLILERIREKFNTEKIVWKDGNHDERLEKYIADKAPALYDLTERPSIRTLLGLDKLNIDYVTDKRIIKIGKLNLLHGHEILSGAGAVNLARTVRLKANANVAFGHFHKTQEDIYTNIEGETIGSWAIGCLCDLKPDYLPINGWNHGFARVQTIQDGTFEFENRKIIGNAIK